jgi:hypothetical protein
MQQIEVKWVMQESGLFLAKHPFLVLHRNDRATPGAPIVYVGRPSQWGNPFPLEEYTVHLTAAANRHACLLDYISNLLYGTQVPLLGQVQYLTDKRLACWCRRQGQWQADRFCHADILCGLAHGVEVL